MIGRHLARLLPRAAMPLARNVYALAYEIRDRIRPPQSPVPLPPARLRYRIGAIDAASYAAIGKRCASDLRHAAERNGMRWRAVGQLLDFGCGTGRTLAWLRRTGPRLHGRDRDPDCVAWCREQLSDASVEQNEPAPPLPFPDDEFDLVYGVSVFTHLCEDEQDRWLDELRRVTRPGGMGLFSFHGPSLAGSLSAEHRRRLRANGILALPVRGLWGLFPSYYNSYHTHEYVRARWSRFGEVREVTQRGMNGHQDLAVLIKT